VIGRQNWRDLLFLHWPVRVDALRPLIPAELTIDTFDGAAYVGLIPFALEGLRPAGVPRALALSFLETNARTYVHAGGADPGVYFFSLDAASRLAVIGARATFGLPYFHARMRFDAGPGTFEHSTQRDGSSARLVVRYEPGAAAGTAAPGTIDHFLLERYVLYAKHLGRMLKARIHHVPYPLRSAGIHALEESILACAGIELPADRSPLVHYSPGVDVELFAPRYLTATK
jgi:uncharacterized protein YqjF (DUF2071 family)